MSHIKNHDIRLLLVVATLIGFAALLASVLWRSAFWGSLAGSNAEGGRGGGGNNSGSQFILVVIAAAALLTVVGIVVGPLIRLALSRNRESLADVSGVELTRNPAGLLSRAEKVATERHTFQEHEPRHRCDVHRRPVAASRQVVPPSLRHPSSDRG